jgi:drug/metabolite transporter (DMT)-like permease
MPDPKRDFSTDLGLLLLAAIWGINFSVVKVALTELEPLAFNALRFPLAAGVMWVLVRRLPGPAAPEPEDLRRILTLGVLGNVLYQLCFIFGLDWTLAGNASLLLSTTPIWTVILSAGVGHERLRPWVAVGVAGTFIGMILVIMGGGDALDLGSQTLKGDLIMVLASIIWSIYTVGSRRPVSRYGALRMTAWTLWAGTPVIVLMGIPDLMRTDLGAVSAATWGGVTYAGVLSVGVAYLLWYRGVQRLGNTRTAIYSNLVPVAALFTAWIWLKEVPGPMQLVGAGVILLGLSVARLTQSPERN